MDFIWESITEWLKEVLIGGIVSNLSSVFDSTNEQVGNIVGQVGMTPQAWNGGIFTMIQPFQQCDPPHCRGDSCHCCHP